MKSNITNYLFIIKSTSPIKLTYRKCNEALNCCLGNAFYNDKGKVSIKWQNLFKIIIYYDEIAFGSVDLSDISFEDAILSLI